MQAYNSIFISDVHLGVEGIKVEELLAFLQNTQSKHLFLVGDIIDGWAMQREWRWPPTYSQIIATLYDKYKNGTKIYYISGNHDDFLKSFLPLGFAENFILDSEVEFQTLRNKKLLITHGDMFDTTSSKHKWLSKIGDIFYILFLKLNAPINLVRRLLGYNEYWSFSKYMKYTAKKITMRFVDYEKRFIEYAKDKGYDGIVCGHIHTAEISKIGDVDYYNTGDWVESKSALVETLEGEFKLIYS